MKSSLFALSLCAALVACDKPADAPLAADTQKPVGSTGSAPAGEAAKSAVERPRDNGSVTPATKSAAVEPAYREVTVPAGTVLPLDLNSSVGSDTSTVEDPVRATLRRAIMIDGLAALPAGSTVTGHVTEAARAARVKG